MWASLGRFAPNARKGFDSQSTALFLSPKIAIAASSNRGSIASDDSGLSPLGLIASLMASASVSKASLRRAFSRKSSELGWARYPDYGSVRIGFVFASHFPPSFPMRSAAGEVRRR